MSSPDEMLHQIGAFEPIDAKRVCEALEARGIPFELEADDSPLAQAGALQAELGMYAGTSKLLVFVPESSLAAAEAVVRELFPV